MAEEEAKEEVAEEEEVEEEAGGGKLVVILTAVNVLVSLGIAAFLFMNFQKEKAQPSVEDITAEDPVVEGEEGKEDAKAKKETQTFGRIIALEQFTVNLSTEGTTIPKFARVNISLEVQTEDTEAELAQKMPQVRNTVIDLFNSKRPTDLGTPDGRSYLKDEIRNALNSFLITGRVKGVFFTSFALSS